LPVDLGEPLEELADLEMILGHGANLGDEFFADILGDSFILNLSGQVIATLGRVFVKRALEEIQGGGDLTFELLLAEPERSGFGIAHVNAYIYAYFRQTK